MWLHPHPRLQGTTECGEEVVSLLEQVSSVTCSQLVFPHSQVPCTSRLWSPPSSLLSLCGIEKRPTIAASKTAHHSPIITHSFANSEKMLQSIQLCFVLPGVCLIQTNFSPSIFLILTKFYSKGQQKYTHLSYLICPNIIYFRVRSRP